MIGVNTPGGTQLLALAWSAAGLGILRAVLWPHAPRAVSAVLYVAVGWAVAVYFPEVHRTLDPVTFVLMITGGGLFTVGAAVYLFRWPDPWPCEFGYHEVFHLLIILGCTCHFIAVAHLALR
jgi:hemolysin III